MKKLILCEINNGICILKLNNPAKKNALSLELLQELDENLENIKNKKNLHSLVLQGEGGNFSVGADLNDITGTLSDEKIDDSILKIINTLEALPILCIAAIEGPCVGGGVSVSLGCDILVASENSFFEIPAIKLGLLLHPDLILKLYSRLGTSSINSILLLGERWNAEKALNMGLVNCVVPVGTVNKKVSEYVQKFSLNPKATSSTKSLILALEKGERNLSYWKQIQKEILSSTERKNAVNQIKKQLDISIERYKKNGN